MAIKLYKAYMFRDKDPAIAEVRKIMAGKFGNKMGAAAGAVEKAGGPSRACMDRWFKVGGTRRPQNATLEAAGRALGMKRVWVEDK